MSKTKGEMTRREFLELGVGTAGAVLVASTGCSESDTEQEALPRNILITYYSDTGNTRKIAQALSEETSRANVTVLKKIDEVSLEDVGGYDIIFIGSPIHGNQLNGNVQYFLEDIPSVPGQKVAGFVTHGATSYSEQDLSLVTEPLKTTCQEKGMEYIGCFNCQGAVDEFLYDMMKSELNLSDEEWDDWVMEMKRHPSDDDRARARAFAREVLKS